MNQQMKNLHNLSIYFIRFHVRDVTGVDGGEGVFSRMHHEMEKVIRKEEKAKKNKFRDTNKSVP